MQQNPYQSPTTEATGKDLIDSNRRGPFQMTIIGFFAGGMLGATAGALASGLLGLVAAIVIISFEQHFESDNEQALVGFTMLGAIFGALLGGAGGTVLGTGLGLLAGLCSERFRGGLIYVSMAFCAVMGAAGGCLGGLMVGGMQDSPSAVGIGTFAIGITLGLLFGSGAGFLLGRGLGHLAWGARKTEADADVATA